MKDYKIISTVAVKQTKYYDIYRSTFNFDGCYDQYFYTVSRNGSVIIDGERFFKMVNFYFLDRINYECFLHCYPSRHSYKFWEKLYDLHYFYHLDFILETKFNYSISRHYIDVLGKSELIPLDEVKKYNGSFTSIFENDELPF